MEERIQKIIGGSGICSRRKAEMLIYSKRVYVNNKQAEIGEKANPLVDIIRIDNFIIPKNIKSKVILINKPQGIICTCNDTHNRKTVIDLLPKELRPGMYPVGRLDLNSRGALLISNNGLLTYQLTHPKYNHSKIYQVWVKGLPNEETLNLWREGIYIDGKKTKKALVKLKKQSKYKSLLEITLFEGRNKQIRRIGQQLKHAVIDLKRVSISNIKLGNLNEGSWRCLDNQEWEMLLK
ncbi:pseudouridine synthase [Prochlorococcus marinus]|uniref:pseudouridine synthase n=1 Tax=Prochlorococcus marinus TaxID=1219 RepID=UPI0022B3EC61|nr:pseudouridine synthase [Prochlorococcus marinus]